MLPVPGLARQALPGRQLVHGEADMLPAGRFRRDLVDAPLGIGRLRLDQ